MSDQSSTSPDWRDYFSNVNTVREVCAAVLAVVLWPLVLLGIDLHLKK